MKTTKTKDLIPKTAAALNVEESLVKNVVDFFYTQLRKKMEALDEPRISVPVLGTFKVSKPKLERSIKHLTKQLETTSPETFNQLTKVKLSQSMIDHQQLMVNKIQKQYEETKKKKEDLGKSK